MHCRCLQHAQNLQAVTLPQAAAGVLLVQVRVAVIREEGSNGDREMSAAVYAAGMEPWDITMSDLIAGEGQISSIMHVGYGTAVIIKLLSDVDTLSVAAPAQSFPIAQQASTFIAREQHL